MCYSNVIGQRDSVMCRMPSRLLYLSVVVLAAIRPFASSSSNSFDLCPEQLELLYFFGKVLAQIVPDGLFEHSNVAVSDF